MIEQKRILATSIPGPASQALQQRKVAAVAAGVSTGLPVYVTMDAGPNVKLLFLQDAEDALRFHFPDLNVVAPF